MDKTADLETDGTEFITCPWCGHEHYNSVEIPDNNEEFDCEECTRSMIVNKTVTVIYSTRKNPMPWDNLEND